MRDLLLILVLGGAGYVLLRKDARTGRSMLDELTGSPLPASVPPGVYAAPPSSSPRPSTGQRVAQYAGLGLSTAGTVAGIFSGTGAAATAGAATAGSAGAAGATTGAAGGIGAGAAVAFAGIAAGAAVLAWAIISKGLFRGGEEALVVSPARDEYFDKWNREMYGRSSAQLKADGTMDARGIGSGLGFALAAERAGFPGYEVQRLLIRAGTADTKEEWQSFTDDATRTFERYATLAQLATPPDWRAAQLRGETVFSSGMTLAQIQTAPGSVFTQSGRATRIGQGADYVSGELARAYAGIGG